MMKPPKPTAAIAYGFCEGSALGRRLQEVLEANGFAISSDLRRADVIIAHSGGAWLLPPNLHAQTVMLVGVPLWPGKWLPARLGRKVLQDFVSYKHEKHVGAWLAKTFWNGVYFWRMPHNMQMLWRQGAPALQALKGKRVAVVRNCHDAVSAPTIHTLLPPEIATFVGLGGEHDDLWQHPEPYVRLLIQLLTQASSV